MSQNYSQFISYSIDLPESRPHTYDQLGTKEVSGDR